MKKIKNIFFVLSFIIIIMAVFCNNVNATVSKTTLNVIKKSSETKYLENNQGYISKEIVDSNTETGEITVKLNILNKDTNNLKYENTEIWIIILEDGQFDEKMQKKIDFTMEMCKNVLSKNSNVKIGIIGVKGPTVSGEQGKIDDAEYVSTLSNDYTFLENNLKNMNSEKKSYLFNHQAALRLAGNSFSNDVNKIVITLVDGITNTGIGIDNIAPSYGGIFSNYNTAEEAINADLNEKAVAVKGEINTLKSKDVNFIVLREEYDKYIYTYGSSSSNPTTVDANRYIDLMYGTTENPHTGKIYLVNDENLKKIIEEDIFLHIISYSQGTMSTLKVMEYFPEEIINNFEFAYVGKPSIGETSDNIDEETKAITWNIDILEGNEEAILEYKLKIKDMKNQELLNKVISINEKTELTYVNYLDEEKTLTSTDSPTIQLLEIKDKENLTAEVSYNPTTDTTGEVIATIKTNKTVKPVDGWTLSEDGKTLTKSYTKNTTEKVIITDVDGMSAEVTVNITNIIPEEDKTISEEKLPNTGKNVVAFIGTVFVLLIVIIAYIKCKNYKEI